MGRGLDTQDADILPGAERLLDGVPAEKRQRVLRCLDARIRRFEAGDPLSRPLPSDADIRFLLDGSAVIVRYDEEGRRTILEQCRTGAVVTGRMTPLRFSLDEIDVVATEPCVALDFRFSSEVEACACCAKYLTLVKNNVISSVSQTNTRLLKRLTILSCRSSRMRIMAFLRNQASEAGSRSFVIPFDRQGLADYLCLDRSALSRELGSMQRDGIISFKRNSFSILRDE